MKEATISYKSEPVIETYQVWGWCDGTTVLTVTIALAVTIEIILKFVFWNKRKKRFEKAMDEKFEELKRDREYLDKEYDEVFWKYLRDKIFEENGR